MISDFKLHISKLVVLISLFFIHTINIYGSAPYKKRSLPTINFNLSLENHFSKNELESIKKNKIFQIYEEINGYKSVYNFIDGNLVEYYSVSVRKRKVLNDVIYEQKGFFKYDSLNRLVKIIEHFGDISKTDTICYDIKGRIQFLFNSETLFYDKKKHEIVFSDTIIMTPFEYDTKSYKLNASNGVTYTLDNQNQLLFKNDNNISFDSISYVKSFDTTAILHYHKKHPNDSNYVLYNVIFEKSNKVYMRIDYKNYQNYPSIENNVTKYFYQDENLILVSEENYLSEYIIYEYDKYGVCSKMSKIRAKRKKASGYIRIRHPFLKEKYKKEDLKSMF